MACAHLFQCIVKCSLRWSNQSQCHFFCFFFFFSYSTIEIRQLIQLISVERSQVSDYPRTKKIQRNQMLCEVLRSIDLVFRWLCLYHIRCEVLMMVCRNFVIRKAQNVDNVTRCHALSFDIWRSHFLSIEIHFSRNILGQQL